MGKTEGPQSKVRGGVGDATETELNGVDGLMNEDLAKVKLQDKILKKSHTGSTSKGIRNGL